MLLLMLMLLLLLLLPPPPPFSPSYQATYLHSAPQLSMASCLTCLPPSPPQSYSSTISGMQEPQTLHNLQLVFLSAIFLASPTHSQSKTIPNAQHYCNIFKQAHSPASKCAL
jgi:hypothetical protein